MFDLNRVRSSWQRESAAIDALITELSEEDARREIRNDGWTTHDIVGHTGSSARAFLRQLQPDMAIPVTMPFDLDTANAQQRDRNQPRPWPDVLSYWQRTRDEVTTFLDTAPADLGDHAVHLPWRPEVSTAGDALRLLILHTRSHREELERATWEDATISSSQS